MMRRRLAAQEMVLQEIVDEAGLMSAMAASRETPVFLFKHSTACPVSSSAHREVVRYVERGGAHAVYLVKVIESRPVSNAISAQTRIEHKSPQLILVDGERAVWTASHYGISEADMTDAAARHGKTS